MAQTFIAKLNNARVTPRKMRLVTDLIKGMPVEKALDQLKFNNKDASDLLIKLVKSASANAEHNFQIDAKELHVKTIFVTNALNYKRSKPASRGRYRMIIRRGCNVTIELAQINK